MEGFSGVREAFFQIHAWDRGCTAYPLVMMQFDKGRLIVDALHKVSGNGLGSNAGQLRQVQTNSPRVSSLYGQPLSFNVELDTRTSPGKVSMSVNNKKIVDKASMSFAPCASPHIKMGVYRPGGKGSGTSRVLLDKVSLQRLQ